MPQQEIYGIIVSCNDARHCGKRQMICKKFVFNYLFKQLTDQINRPMKLLTTCEAAWYIILVVFVCMSVCLSGRVRIGRSSGQGQGNRSQKGRHFLFQRRKTSIGNNSVLANIKIDVCVQHGVFGYGRSIGVTSIFGHVT